jgi:ABC-type uncharacterized transport system permease subunit
MSETDADPSAGTPTRRPLVPGGAIGLLLVAPALAIIAVFFALPLGLSVVGAFRDRNGVFTLANVVKAWELYSTDFVFTVAIVLLSSALIAAFAALLGIT